jgi:hypothetical protein
MKYQIKYNQKGGVALVAPLGILNIFEGEDTNNLNFIKCKNNKSLANTPYRLYNIDIKGITQKYKQNSCMYPEHNNLFNLNCLTPVKKNGFWIVEIPENYSLYKGMGCVDKTNLDLSNSYGNKKSWYSDFETSQIYAKEEGDGIHVYKPQRNLTLFCLNNTENLKLLISKIDNRKKNCLKWKESIKKCIINVSLIVDTFQRLLVELNSANNVDETNSVILDLKIPINIVKHFFVKSNDNMKNLKKYVNSGENWRQSQTLLDSINNIKSIVKSIDNLSQIVVTGGALPVPVLRSSSQQINRSGSQPILSLRAVSNPERQYDTERYQQINDYISNIYNLIKFLTIFKEETLVYPKVLENEINNLEKKKNNISFTTGYGMTWLEQIRYMQTQVVDRGSQTNRFNFKFRNVDAQSDIIGFKKNDSTNKTYCKFKINGSTFGKDRNDLNRVSLSTDEDLQMCNIIEEFFNVDGYWSSSVISYYHERGTFPREVCIFNGRILNRDKTDPMDWMTYSRQLLPPAANEEDRKKRANEKLPKLPDNYSKIIYYKFDGEYDTKTYKPIDIAPGLNVEQRAAILDNQRENVPLDPLTYMFRGNKEGDLVIF